MFSRLLSVFLALMMGVLQSIGIATEPVDLTPTIEIIGQYTCADKNPEIEISVDKTTYRIAVCKDSVSLGGAFRDLEVKSVIRKTPCTLLVKTKGEVNEEFSTGYVLIASDAVRADTTLMAETEMDMSLKDPGIIGGSSVAPEDIAKNQLKAFIVKGINKIPYVGGYIAPYLDSTINEILGIKTAPSTAAIYAKLNEISQQLNDISFKLDKSSQEILKSLYANQNFSYVNQQATSLRDDVTGVYEQLAALEDESLSEYNRYVRMASLLEFDGQYASDIVKNTKTLSAYISGDQVSINDEENIFVKAFNYACQDAVFGGEAATVIAPYINEISNIFANSYKAMSLVLLAKLYVCENYNKIVAAAETDPALKNALSLLPRQGNYDMDNNNLSYNYWKSLLSEKDISSLAKRHNELFGDDEKNPSLADKYNQMVLDRWFSFIKKAEAKSDGIDVVFVELSKNISSVTPTELGMDTTKHDEATRTMVGNVDKKLEERLYKCVDSADIKKIVEHVLKNANKVFVEKEETDGIHVTRNIFKILEDYGFVFPEAKEGKLIFTATSSDSFSSKTAGFGVASTEYSASLTVNGFNCENNIEYYSSLESASDIKWENTKYYNHSCSITNGQLCNNRTTSEKCTFYYFAPAPIELKTEADFVDFMIKVSNGNTYAQETISLETDVSLSNDTYENIWKESQYESVFKGTFNGNSHTISGLADTTSYPGGGLFRTLGEGAQIANLNFEDVKIEGKGEKSGFGTVAGRVTGNAVISSIIVKSGMITGYDKVGGIVGEVTNGSLVIKDCDNYAEIYARGKYAGGILGASTSKKTQNITVCTNFATVTANNGSGTAGIVGYLANDSADQPHTVKYCINNGNVESVGGNTGGIIGHLDTDSTSHEVARNSNYGNIDAPTGNAGGIVGYSEGGAKSDANDKFTANSNYGRVTGKQAGGILGYNEDDTIVFDDSVNAGAIYATTNAGGIAGYLGNNDEDDSYIARNCKNSGSITAQTGAAGGIFGHLDTDGVKQIISGNENSGDVKSESSYAGGIVANSEGGGDFTNNINSGNITSGKDGGGIVGYNEDDSIKFNGSVNTGNITSTADAGGIVGFAGSKSNDKAYTFINCSNSGIISSATTNAGGIAAVIRTDNKNHNFTDCTNDGKVTGNLTAGGIIGSMFGGGQISECVNMADIKGTGDYAGGIVGKIEDDRCTFSGNVNSGDVSSSKYQGPICGYDGYRKSTY